MRQVDRTARYCLLHDQSFSQLAFLRTFSRTVIIRCCISQAFRVVRRPNGNVIIASDGLSDPFDDISLGETEEELWLQV